MLRNENYDKQIIIGIIITVFLLASFSFLMFGEDLRIVEDAEIREEEVLQHGRELFAENCAACHGADGEGISGPALNEAIFLEKAGDGVLFATIQTGRPNTAMPAWGQAYGGALTNDDVQALVSFIRSYEENAPEAAAAQPSEEEPGLYSAEIAAQAFQKGGCGACHTIPGVEGAVGTLGPDLSEIGKLVDARIGDGSYPGDATTVDEYLVEAIEDPNAFIAPDCPTGPCVAGLMPPFSGTFSSQEMDAVVSYLAALR